MTWTPEAGPYGMAPGPVRRITRSGRAHGDEAAYTLRAARPGPDRPRGPGQGWSARLHGAADQALAVLAAASSRLKLRHIGAARVHSSPAPARPRARTGRSRQ
jgi:hypothetical protein